MSQEPAAFLTLPSSQVSPSTNLVSCFALSCLHKLCYFSLCSFSLFYPKCLPLLTPIWLTSTLPLRLSSNHLFQEVFSDPPQATFAGPPLYSAYTLAQNYHCIAMTSLRTGCPHQTAGQGWDFTGKHSACHVAGIPQMFAE